MKTERNLSSLIQEFFTEYLINQKRASQNTIASYRDTFCLLLRYAEKQYKKSPIALLLSELDARFICKFLVHIEKDRNVCVRSRNQRLAAIHSFFHFISLYVPEQIGLIQQVLAIPSKRCEKKNVTFLKRPEIDSLLDIPDRETWIGRRDHALLLLLIQTGLRVSELTTLRGKDVVLESVAYVHCTGKGRKERCTPLTKETVRLLKTWVKENNHNPTDFLFPSTRGGQLNTDTVRKLLTKYVVIAQKSCSSLKNKRVTPHVLRHTAAMQMLEAGIGSAMIALWLGHESPNTTQIYLEADLSMKEKLLEKMKPIKVRKGRFKVDDRLLAFLKGL